MLKHGSPNENCTPFQLLDIKEWVTTSTIPLFIASFKSKKRFLHSINAHGHSPSQSPVVTGGSSPNFLGTVINQTFHFMVSAIRKNCVRTKHKNVNE